MSAQKVDGVHITSSVVKGLYESESLMGSTM